MVLNQVLALNQWSSAFPDPEPTKLQAHDMKPYDRKREIPSYNLRSIKLKTMVKSDRSRKQKQSTKREYMP